MSSDARTALERRIPALLRAGDVTGLSIAVLRDGKLYWSGAFGIADPATGAPVRPDTVFAAASLSKPVFAYLVFRLIDRRVLGLDTPLAGYLPYPRLAHDDRYRRITARMVLSHTTGMPNLGGERLELGFAPGEHWSYSGAGFVYLQKVVEKLTGTPLAELAHREVFAPLGMNHSSYVWQDGVTAAAGVNELGATRPISRKRPASAAASLRTTAEDYARFVLAVLGGWGLTPKAAAAMLAAQINVPAEVDKPASTPRDDIGWGLGWGLARIGGSEILWHWGNEDGWRAFTATRRDGKAGIVLLANSYNGLTIAHELTRLAGVGDLPVLGWLQFESFDDPRWIARRDLLAAFAGQGTAAGMRRFAEIHAAAPGVADAALANELAALLRARGKTREGATLLEQVAEEAPSAAAYARAGEAWLAAGDLDRALHGYETAAKLDPATSRAAAIRWIHEDLALRANPVTLPDETLRGFAGDYGERHVRLESGALMYHRDGLSTTYRLQPANADTFLAEGNASARFRFITDASDHVAKLVLLGPDGPVDESLRDK